MKTLYSLPPVWCRRTQFLRGRSRSAALSRRGAGARVSRARQYKRDHILASVREEFFFLHNEPAREQNPRNLSSTPDPAGRELW